MSLTIYESLMLVLGMSLVTYLPRAIPMVFMKKMTLPPFLLRFLRFIPYAALGALIFPGILTSTGDLASSVVGGIFAGLMAIYKKNLLLVVLTGISGAFLYQWFVL